MVSCLRVLDEINAVKFVANKVIKFQVTHEKVCTRLYFAYLPSGYLAHRFFELRGMFLAMRDITLGIHRHSPLIIPMNFMRAKWALIVNTAIRV